MRLLNQQKLDLFNGIKSCGSEPSLFEISEGDVTTLRFKRSDYVCTITYDEGDQDSITHNPWEAKVCPGEETWEQTNTAGYWEELRDLVLEWVMRIQRELQTPDPWIALQNTPLPDAEPDADSLNTQLTVTEWESLRKGIEGIRTLLLENSGSSETAAAHINRQLDKVIEDGKKFGRKDWFNLAVGTLANLAVSIGCQPAVTRQLWQLLKSAVAGVVHLTPIVTEAAKHLSQ